MNEYDETKGKHLMLILEEYSFLVDLVSNSLNSPLYSQPEKRILFQIKFQLS